MIGRIVEVETDGVHLSAERGFMAVTRAREVMGRVALDDIAAVVVHGHGATWSANLAVRLAERGAPFVICGANHAPAALVWPLDGHHEQGMRMQAQAEAAKPLKKRLWRDLVRGKILSQAAVLDSAGENPGPLRGMARLVRPGDPENIEARAARRYWPALMGRSFRRDRAEGGANAMLNYGYTVLRAAAARSISAAGLHPSLSVHHESRGSALRLADDVMEPFRPFVDSVVRGLIREGEEAVTRDVKARLAAVATLDLAGPRGASPLQTCLDRLAVTLAQTYMGEAKTVELPGPPLALSGAGRP